MTEGPEVGTMTRDVTGTTRDAFRQEFSPGLAGVPAARSSISFVNGQTGLLEYRGIRIEELAERSSFLETTYLLLYDQLPDQAELDRFTADVTQHRRIKYRITDLIKCLPEHGRPMDALQAAVAALGMFYPARNVLDRQVQYWSAVRLIAKVPTIVAAYHRLRRGDEQIQPRDDLDHASNFLYMLTEKGPDPLAAKVLDTCLILHAEHTMNASTFSGMVSASTLTDPYTVVSSAIGTLKGPLHGGAAQETVEMLEEIGSVGNVRPYIKQRLAAKQKLMGFGHRLYKVKDPRAIILQKLAQQLFAQSGRSHSTGWPKRSSVWERNCWRGKASTPTWISTPECSTKRWASMKTSSRVCLRSRA